MRLAILTQYYPPEMGAPQARLSELAKRFVERGHEVFVLTAMPNYPRGQLYPGYGGLLRHEMRDGVSVIRTCIYPTKSVGLIRRLANYFSFVFSSSIAGSLKLPRVDYLLTESPPLFLGISGYFLSRLKRTRWIFNVSDLWPESAVHLGVVKEGWALRLAYALEAFNYQKAWLVTGQSREILESIQRRFPHVETYHLSNGVDTKRFQINGRFAPSGHRAIAPSQTSPHRPIAPSLRGAARQELADGKACLAIYGGLHGIAQGLDQILAAAARLEDVEELAIALVGDGPEKEALIAQAQAQNLKNVRFIAPQPRERMPSLLASADIALVPLKQRLPGAVPSKLYEAMGASLPVVLVAEGEAANIVHESQAGIVVRPGDIEGLTSALRQLVENPSQRRQMGDRGREAAVARFDCQAIGDAFIDFLEERL